MIFMIPSRLTRIKSKDDCREILHTLSSDNILTFSTGRKQNVTIVPDSDNAGHYLFYYHTGKIEWFEAGFSHNEEEAAKELYKLRVHYHNKWKD